MSDEPALAALESAEGGLLAAAPSALMASPRRRVPLFNSLKIRAVISASMLLIPTTPRPPIRPVTIAGKLVSSDQSIDGRSGSMVSGSPAHVAMFKLCWNRLSRTATTSMSADPREDGSRARPPIEMIVSSGKCVSLVRGAQSGPSVGNRFL